MSIEITPSRRTVLAAGAGALTLAACGSSATNGPAAAGGGSAAAGPLTTLDAVPVGGAVAVNLPDGKPGIVARPTATTAVAFSAICTHQGCQVAPAGAKLNCPCHGSVYNALTGAVESGPAPSPLPKVTVKVVEGKVLPG